MASPFHTSRLIFRAPETPEDNDFFQALQQDPHGYANSNFSISKPQSKKDATEYQKWVSEKAMLGVVFCIREDPATAEDRLKPQDPAKPEEGQKQATPTLPKAIGCIHLGALKPDHAQHRHSTIGIDVLPEHQGKGYGSEAIKWALKWAFVTRGLHRVNISAFGYNEGAVKLYERLGFVLEGRQREFAWFQGKWYDDVDYGMLEDEWREKYGGQEI